MKQLRLLLVVSWLAVLPIPGHADFADGLAAFDGGDYETAYAEWRDLTENGDTEAQVSLADLYLSGQGVAANTAEAVHWYRKAAEAGDAVAQLNLGDFYAKGFGVERDLISAYVWLSLSAAQGRRWPAWRRAGIAGIMTPAQIAEAKARLKVWRSAQ